MRRAAFAALVLKFRPAKDNAAAKAPAEVFVLEVVVPEVTALLLFGAAIDDWRLWTDICRLLARAFSCWRMNCAKDFMKTCSVSQIPCSVSVAVRFFVLSMNCTHPDEMMPILSLQAVHLLLCGFLRYEVGVLLMTSKSVETRSLQGK